MTNLTASFSLKGLFESKRVQILFKEHAHMSAELIKESLLSSVLEYSNQQIDDDIVRLLC